MLKIKMALCSLFLQCGLSLFALAPAPQIPSCLITLSPLWSEQDSLAWQDRHYNYVIAVLTKSLQGFPGADPVEFDAGLIDRLGGAWHHYAQVRDQDWPILIGLAQHFLEKLTSYETVESFSKAIEAYDNYKKYNSRGMDQNEDYLSDVYLAYGYFLEQCLAAMLKDPSRFASTQLNSLFEKLFQSPLLQHFEIWSALFAGCLKGVDRSEVYVARMARLTKVPPVQICLAVQSVYFSRDDGGIYRLIGLWDRFALLPVSAQTALVQMTLMVFQRYADRPNFWFEKSVEVAEQKLRLWNSFSVWLGRVDLTREQFASLKSSLLSLTVFLSITEVEGDGSVGDEKLLRFKYKDVVRDIEDKCGFHRNDFDFLTEKQRQRGQAGVVSILPGHVAILEIFVNSFLNLYKECLSEKNAHCETAFWRVFKKFILVNDMESFQQILNTYPWESCMMALQEETLRKACVAFKNIYFKSVDSNTVLEGLEAWCYLCQQIGREELETLSREDRSSPDRFQGLWRSFQGTPAYGDFKQQFSFGATERLSRSA